MTAVAVRQLAQGVQLLTLSRPEAMNALSSALLEELMAEVERLVGDASVRAVIFTGAGERAFCAGADLKERRDMTATQAKEAVRRIRSAVAAVAALPMPTIAAIRGVALGGGLELALACDLRVVASDATIGLTETRLAIIPGAGGTQRLARLIGPARAKELIFTGRRLSGEQALEYGIAQHVRPASDVLDQALELALHIAAGGPLAVRQAKRAIDGGLELSLEQGLEWEMRAYDTLFDTEDRVEGLLAFAEKRPPRYQGR
ncbi:MAG: enoyl-CoA hydratase-related protein [Firmicutes bacterium]|nr:enoyl-CoA hydratase-related protein [Bacillota bacterium]